MEFVYVVPRDALFPECYPQGLVLFGEALDREDLEARIRAEGFFVERARAERTPAWKQVIPYTVVVANGEVFVTRRLPKGGEARLFGKLSIGIGGHINPIDTDVDGDGTVDVIRDGTARELDEELFVSGERRLEAVGLINDDSNAVGAVHVGLVQVLHLEGPDASVRVREEDVLDGRLAAPEALEGLASGPAEFETWSRMLVEQLASFLHFPSNALS